MNKISDEMLMNIVKNFDCYNFELLKRVRDVFNEDQKYFIEHLTDIEAKLIFMGYAMGAVCVFKHDNALFNVVEDVITYNTRLIFDKNGRPLKYKTDAEVVDDE